MISDTSPSLRLTLEALGLGEFLDACVCSDEVGVMKPDPRIYRAALGVRAEESLYVGTIATWRWKARGRWG